MFRVFFRVQVVKGTSCFGFRIQGQGPRALFYATYTSAEDHQNRSLGLPQSAQPPRQPTPNPRHSTTPRTRVHGCRSTSTFELVVRESRRRLRSGEHAEPRDHHHSIQHGRHELLELGRTVSRHVHRQRNSIQVARHSRPRLRNRPHHRGWLVSNTSAAPPARRMHCEGSGDVVGVLTLLVGGAQTCHDDRVVELRVQLGVQEVEGKDREEQVEVEREKRVKEGAPWMVWRSL